jgi:hypothetical protein
MEPDFVDAEAVEVVWELPRMTREGGGPRCSARGPQLSGGTRPISRTNPSIPSVA